MENKEETPQEELEQKISEAEIQAQEDDSLEGEELSAAVEEVPEAVTEDAPPEKEGLSQGRKIWRGILIWLVVIAIAFAGGFFLDTMLRYQPEQERVADLQADLNDAQMEITALEDEVDRLSSFEDINIALVEEINQLNLHLVLLSLRASIADAALAMEQGRQDDAKLALAKVGTTLAALKDSLTAEQGEVVESMMQRYELIMIEMENNGATVLTDLDLLRTKLITLENTLFSSP